MYQLRIYTLADHNTAQVYFDEVWKDTWKDHPSLESPFTGFSKP